MSKPALSLADMLQKEKEYWSQKLSGELSVTEFPLDFKRRAPAEQKAVARFDIDEETERRLTKLSGNKETLLFVILVAALEVCLHKYTGSEDIIVGTTIHEQYAKTASLNTLLVLRDRVCGAMTVKELLLEARRTLGEAYSNQKFAVGKILETLSQRNAEDKSPLVNIFIILESINNRAHIEALANDMTFAFSPDEHKVAGTVEYEAALFKRETIETLIERYKMVLHTIVSSPETRISRLSILTEAERHQLLIEWNATKSQYPGHNCIHELFERQVERRPEAVAIRHGDGQMSYRELNTTADLLAAHLASIGIRPGSLVGLCMECCPEMIIGIMGILKAGGAYLPLDPRYPLKRLTAIVEESEVRVLVTLERWSSALPANVGQVICLDTEDKRGREGDVLITRAGGDDLAYVIYTSGSTGKPKGVKIQHKALVNYVNWAREMYVREEGDDFALYTSLGFDLTVTSIYAPLISGNAVVVYENEDRVRGIEEIVREDRVAVLKVTPSHLKLIKERDNRGRRMRRLIVGGEALERSLARQVKESFGGTVEIINEYGPTEATVGCMIYRYEEGRDERSHVPIGSPAANTQVYILDNDLEPVVIGYVGEIYIGGNGLAGGYMNRPALTASQFVPDPFNREPGARLYRSGDLARFLPDGTIEFEGRRDSQVKIRGFRVELSEVEAALSSHDAIDACIALVREDVPGDKRLVAYVVQQTADTLSARELRAHLQEKLPDYMIPSAFVTVDSFPLTTNGKLDRKALPAPKPTDTESGGEYRAPRDLFELRLTRIWEAVLGVRPVGIRDNFFDLGGHSILSVLLMDRIKNTLGIDLPAATLFRGATVEDLAVQVRRRTDSAVRFTSLVEIQTGRSTLPFFCVHPAGGNVFCYMDLVREMGPDRAFYGFQSRGLTNGEPLHLRIEDMAAHYLELLVEVQAEGPYFLGGWSIGGLIAFEMSQQLQAQGKEVSLLALFDTVAPTQYYKFEDLNHLRLLRAFAQDMGLPLERLGIPENESSKLEPDEQLNRILEQAKSVGVLPFDVSVCRVRHLLKVFVTNVKAAHGYSPATCSGRVTLFRAAEPESGLPDRGGWNELLSNQIDVHITPGRHFTMLRKPNVRVLAEQLKSCMDKAVTSGRVC